MTERQKFARQVGSHDLHNLLAFCAFYLQNAKIKQNSVPENSADTETHTRGYGEAFKGRAKCRDI
jgi:hypothetical protein